MISHIFIIILLGIIEGITEFFPISSSSHIIMITKLFQIDSYQSHNLNIFIQSGTALSILFYFRKEFWKLLLSLLQLHKKNYFRNNFKLYCLIISSIPITLIGLNINNIIQSWHTPINIIYGLLCGNIMLFLAEIFKKKTKHENKINLIKSLIIGFFQCSALLPGFSRSGSTISGGILSGLKQSKSVKFSFLLSVPILFGALILNIITNKKNIKQNEIPLLLLGFTISFITSQFTVKKYFKIISKCSLIPFIIYRLLLSILIYFFLL